jgi:hypothetical protein
MKTWNSNSWVIQTKKLLQKYKLPTIPELAFSDTSKEEWKRIVKSAIYDLLEEQIKNEAMQKSTLSYLNPIFITGYTHTSIRYLEHPREISRANIKIRLLTQTYKLQVFAFKYKQVKEPKCPICLVQDEDLEHFILSCPLLEPARRTYIMRINEVIPHVYSRRQEVFSSPRFLLQLVLDPTHPELRKVIDMHDDIITELEPISRDMCYALHLLRTKMLSQTT